MRRLAALALVVACSAPAPPAGPADAHVDAWIHLPDAPPPADPCAAPIALDELATCLDRAWCARLAACGYGQLGDTSCTDLPVPIVAGLDARTLADAIARSVSHRRSRYDAVAAAACVAAIADAPCRTISPTTMPTDGCAALVGAVPASGSCNYPFECAEGSACVGQGGSQFVPVCGGDRCLPQVARWMPCSNAPCEPGDHCTYLRLTGSICTSGETDAPCSADLDCDAGFFCDHPTSLPGSGACTAALAIGAPCTRDAQCSGPLVCVGEALAAGGTCADPSSAGAPCDTQCRGPYLCSAPDPTMLGSCVAAPGVGDPCVPGAGCGLFLRCGADDRCAPRVGVGAACATGADCALGLVCTADVVGTPTGTCVAPLPDGTACVSPDQCASSTCTDHVCEPFAGCP